MYRADRSSEPEMAISQVVPEVRLSARTQAGFAALDLITERCIPVSHEDSFVGDYQRDGAEEQHQSCQRLEVVRLTSEDAPGVARCPRTRSWTGSPSSRRVSGWIS